MLLKIAATPMLRVTDINYFLINLQSMGAQILSSWKQPSADFPFQPKHTEVPTQSRLEVLDRALAQLNLPHAYSWHQFSVQGHSRMVVRTYTDWLEGRGFVSRQLSTDVTRQIFQHLNQDLEGRSKRHLLAIGLIFHDIGKFAPEVVVSNNVGNYRLNFYHHEQKSSDLIKGETIVRAALESRGYTPKQIAYIADVAALHYELGHVRHSAHSHKAGYSFDYLTSSHFEPDIRAMFEGDNIDNRNYANEIGIMFLCDSLGKTWLPPLPFFQARECKDDVLAESILRAWMDTNRMPNRLYQAFFELPINMATVARYFSIYPDIIEAIPS